MNTEPFTCLLRADNHQYGEAAREITFNLTFDKGKPFEVTQFEGEMIRIGEKGVAILGITPHITDIDNEIVTMQVFEVNKVRRKGKVVTDPNKAMNKCCVTCNGEETCASSVETNCGGCYV